MYVFINRIKFKANITSANLIIFFLNSNQSFIKTQKILNSNNFLPKSTTSAGTYPNRLRRRRTLGGHRQKAQHQLALIPTENMTLSVSIIINSSKRSTTQRVTLTKPYSFPTHHPDSPMPSNLPITLSYRHPDLIRNLGSLLPTSSGLDQKSGFAGTRS